MTPTGILVRPHAAQMMRERGIATLELLGALGPSLVDAGALRLPTAATAQLALPGRPVVLGWQAPDQSHADRRYVLLARTTRGRHLVVVLAVAIASVTIVTVWDQDGQPHLWHPGGVMPTELGRRSMPPTYWCASRRWDVTQSRSA